MYFCTIVVPEMTRIMIDRIKKILASRHLKSNLLLIITAAVLLEMISGVQYYYSHNLLETELEKRAETELMLKSVIASSSGNIVENALLSHIRDIKQDLAYPDSMYGATEWLVKHSKRLAGGGIAFIPYYYPQKGRLFEPYAYWKDGKIVITEISKTGHDYTHSSIFKQTIESNSAHWSKRYHDILATNKDLISYCLPIHDNNEKPIAVLYMDIDTEWLGDTLNFHHLFPSSFDLLLTKEGELVAGPRESFVSKATIDHVISIINDSTVKKQKSEKGNCWVIPFRNPENGDKGQLFISQMKGNDRWQVVVACYDKEVFGALKNMRLTILLLMAIAFIVLVWIINHVALNDRRFQKTEMEKKRIDGELRVANSIQQSMLPDQYMLQDDVEIGGSLVPAREVGGDLFDYYVRNEKVLFCIGDVSGKGVASAMLMGVVQSMFRAFSAHENNPAHIMQAINEASCRGNKSNMFVTLFIGVLDLPTGCLHYCDAGHDAPIILSEKKLFPLNVDPHLPVGVFNTVKYDVQKMNLMPDSIIFLYTDGLTEAMNKERQQFRIERVEAVLTTCLERELRPQDILKTIGNEVRLFTDGSMQSDDLTMLAIRYTPHHFESILTETLILKNDVHEVSKLNSFLKSVAVKINIEPSLAHKLRLAVEEAVVNVIDYAYPADTEGSIEVRMMWDGKKLKVMIIDAGVPFDPTVMEKTDTTLSAEERQIGGLGILLVRELMDAMNYERMDGKNVLTLMKELKS